MLILYLQHGMAFFRGVIVSCLFALNKHKVGKWLRIYRNVEIRRRKNGNVQIGSNVKIDRNAVLSVSGGSNLQIGDHVCVGCNNMIMCHEHIVIGNGTIMGPNVLIYDHDHCFDRTGVEKRKYVTSPVHIGENCWIGAGTIILRGTVIGNNCVVGAGATLKGTYPDGSIIVQKRNTVVRSC